jgi:hypothetical protein
MTGVSGFRWTGRATSNRRDKMNDPIDDRSQYIDDNPDFGGASAGAQDGGIVDTGSADDETDYSDALVGRKGGMVRNDVDADYPDGDEDFVAGGGSGEDESNGIGSLGDKDSIGTDRGMPGTWAGGTSTTNSSGL